MRRLLVVIVLGATLLTIGNAADAAVLGTTATRRTVETLVHRAYPNLVFGNVACPAGIVKQRGVKFTCTVQLPGTFLVVEAVQTDGKGSVSVTTPQAVVAQALLKLFVGANSSLPATVDCGPGPWLVARPATKIVCTATLADGTVRHAELTVNDTAGNVTITAVTP
jgi:hypothetical protein